MQHQRNVIKLILQTLESDWMRHVEVVKCR